MPDEQNIAALILAAGQSTRFGSADKLLAKLDNEHIIIHALRPLIAAHVQHIAAVVAESDGAVSQALQSHLASIEIIENPDAEQGMATSIRAGVRALQETASGILIVPGDMPFMNPSVIRSIISAFHEAGGEKIVVPVLPDGAQRNPVLWPRRFFGELLKLEGDRGGKQIITANKDSVTELALNDERFSADIDTENDLRLAQREG
jgi:molybdenum cofactor cytidylyltransferase